MFKGIWLMYLVFLGALFVGLGVVYVRWAPSALADWHQPIAATADVSRPSGAVRIVSGDAQDFAALDVEIRALPRTEVLAGTVDEGRVTYVTRSAVLGFPDYTTIEQRDGQIAAYARLRFGHYDFGVNAQRLAGLSGLQ